MRRGDYDFQILKPYVYSPFELSLIGEFKKLGPVEMYDFWEKTNEGQWAELKRNIKTHYVKAQDFRCAYCLQRIEVSHNGAWDLEHIIPRKTHPHFSFEPENLCVSCKDCNGSKGDKKISSASIKQKFSNDASNYLIAHAHFDQYSDHIRVISVAGFYMPRTIKGKMLIEVCGLLRFLFKYSGYECDIAEVQAKSFELNNLLQENSDSLVLNYVFDCLEDLAREGKRLLREKRLASI